MEIPSSVTIIGNYVFYGCTSLADVYSLNETPPTCGSSYVFSTSTYSDATLHVPSEAVDVYKETSPWSSFYSIEATTGIATVTKDDGACVEAGDGVITVTGAEGTVSVYGIGGAKVGEAAVTGGTVEISVPHGGVYVVRVASGGESVTTKVVVK